MTDRKKDRHAKNNLPPIYQSGGIKMPRPLGGNVFLPIGVIFELVQDNIGMNFLTNFYEDRTTNVASSVLTSHILKNTPPLRNHWTINMASRVLTRQMLTPHNTRRRTKGDHKSSP
ncbi:hypothetical protein DPMN_172400 [Dreissena polymorpha]|uniref:Uncharacterized protein n=1 Tax=Dreissena polymorpha TaxID=45954 RepID=A0A9D4E0Z0_DREPO|nr:hypothetical protein DPMN_172400 [Dreissena polymorpha]